MIMLGYHQLEHAPPLGLGMIMRWRHNPKLTMTEKEQLEWNKKNYSGFFEEKYLPPAVSFKLD